MSNEVDEFDVPASLLGSHSDDFFAVLGRIVGLSALLDYRLLRLYQALTRSAQHEHTKLKSSELIKQSRKLVSAMPASETRELALEFLASAKSHANKRNDYVHNLWPAQAGDRMFGWRLPRKLNEDNPHGTPAITVEMTRGEMHQDLLSLVYLLDPVRWHRLEHYALSVATQTEKAGPA